MNFPLYKLSDSSSSEIFTYDNNSSPLHFRNYIGISKDDKFNNQIFIDNDFWIASIQVRRDNKTNFTFPKEYSMSPSAFYLCNSSVSVDEQKTKKGIRKGFMYGCLTPIALGAIVYGVLYFLTPNW